MNTLEPPVLVVGGGPVGLTSATELIRRGVPVRCVDKADGPSPLSKALVVWPRALEVLRSLGGDALITGRGLPVDSLKYFSANRPIANVGFKPHTKPVILPQPDVEALLGESLTNVGGRVEWRTELLELTQDGDGATALLRGPDGVERRERFSYVVGADGASSTVRTILDIPFDGATYPNTFVVADVTVDGALQHDASYYYCSPRGVLVIVGLPGGRFRVFTSAPTDLDRENVPLSTVQELVDARGPGGLRLRDPSWMSAFSVHARHAARTREGRIFLAGDSAHIHSPAGGQGMNTGITDAHNLAWKLAMVWHGDAPASLLDTYEPERAEIARAVVRQADLQTKAWMLAKPHQVKLRDAAVRAASALRLGDIGFVPWLAGLKARYARTGPERYVGKLGGFTPGALAPGDIVWDSREHRRAPLRTALDPLRYTLLVAGGPGALPSDFLDEIASKYSGLVDLRTLRADELVDGFTEPGGRRGAGVLVLIRPDQHVDGVVRFEDFALLRDRLSELLRPGRGATLLRLPAAS